MNSKYNWIKNAEGGFFFRILHWAKSFFALLEKSVEFKYDDTLDTGFWESLTKAGKSMDFEIYSAVARQFIPLGSISKW